MSSPSVTGRPDRERLEERRTEFETHVWNHSEDAFQQSFDSRRPLTGDEVKALQRVRGLIGRGCDNDQVSRSLQILLNQDPALVYPIMQVVGLTRNKILQDLKATLANTNVSVPSSPERLHQKESVWSFAGPYLAKRLRVVLTPLSSIDDVAFTAACEGLNQATWQGWIRQERAKRSGHEAEHRVATILWSLGVPFQPIEKVNNPLCADLQYEGVSFDLALVENEVLKFGVKATVHTSNIGQYGESKDALEIIEARAMLDNVSPSGILLAMIDGVGFRSNRAGLDGVLTNADEFCQFKTIWKAAVVAAFASRHRLAIVLPDEEAHRSFLERYSSSIEICDSMTDPSEWIEAGEAFLRRVS